MASTLSVLPQQTDASRASGFSDPSETSFGLTGHSGEVFTCDFSSSGMLPKFTHFLLRLGDIVASAGFDRSILLWKVNEGFHNSTCLRGHTNAILQIKFNPMDPTKLFTASADKSVAWWDAVEGERVKKLTGHTSIVNCCSMARSGPPIGFSGADDGTVKVWDMRERRCVNTFEHSYQILSVDSSEDGNRIFAGTIDDSILMLDSRSLDTPIEIITTSSAEIDSVTGIAISNDGDSLLSISMNGTAHLWDIRPFCESEDRLQYTYHKIANNYEMSLLRIHWSPDDLLFSTGSSDRVANIHKVRPDINDMDTLVCSLTGHEGTVHETVFHPKQRYAVLSCSSDKNLLYQANVC